MSALKGLRILDLTLTLPGPYCTHLLADFGAEVIKIENPEGGDWFRHEEPAIKGLGLRFLDLNRNKKSLTLNLKTPAGKEIFFALARSSQGVVEGFCPAEVYNFLKKTFRQKTRDEWVAFFHGQDVCLGPVKNMGETLEDPQIRHRQMIVDVEHPQAGQLKQIGIPIKLSETPGKITSLAPSLGQHTKEILQELGYSAEAIEGFRREKVI